MSLYGFKQQLLVGVRTITWTIPTTATAILGLPTAFGRVDAQQFGDQIGASEFPYCRIHLPELEEHRETAGGDTGSLKQQRLRAHLFIYHAGYGNDWLGLGDYFDTIVDATLAYFRGHASPQPGGVALAQNDHLVGQGLTQQARVELPERIDDALHYRATVSVDLIGYMV